MKKKLNPFLYLLASVIIFIVYWNISTKIESEYLYPSLAHTLNMEIFQKYAPTECFYIFPVDFIIDSKNKKAKINMFFEKRCNFTYSLTWVTITNTTQFHYWNRDNLKIDNISREGHRMLLRINSSSMESGESYYFSAIADIEEADYHYYNFDAQGTNIYSINFDIDNSLLKGFKVDESSFYVQKGKVTDIPLFRGFNKQYSVEDSPVELRFSPQSKWWNFWLKFFDAFATGFILILLYEFFKLDWGKKFVKLLKFN